MTWLMLVKITLFVNEFPVDFRYPLLELPWRAGSLLLILLLKVLFVIDKAIDSGGLDVDRLSGGSCRLD